MDIIQLINAVQLNHFGQTYDISLNWIGQIIEWLISGIGYVGLGIIVFSFKIDCFTPRYLSKSGDA